MICVVFASSLFASYARLYAVSFLQLANTTCIQEDWGNKSAEKGLLQRLAVAEARALRLARQSSEPGRKHQEALAKFFASAAATASARNARSSESTPSSLLSSTKTSGQSKKTTFVALSSSEGEGAPAHGAPSDSQTGLRCDDAAAAAECFVYFFLSSIIYLNTRGY